MSPSSELVLVTGAAGCIGSNIASVLVADGHDVVACDRFREGDKWRYLARVLLHDIIRPEEAMAWLVQNSDRVSTIIHMGAISSTTEVDVDKIVANNVRFSLDLWQHATAHDVTFIYASSAATYGDGGNGFTDDDTPAGLARLRPLNPYAWSKHVVDRRIAHDVTNGRPTPRRWAGLKFFNVYGPNEGHKGPMRSIVHKIYPQAAAGLPVSLFKSHHPDYADGGQLRDFVYVKDCCEVVRAMLAAPTLAGIFNVGTGRARSFADVATAVFGALGQEVHIEYVDPPVALRDRYQYFTQADTTKLRTARLAPEFHDVEAGVIDYVSTHLVHELGQ